MKHLPALAFRRRFGQVLDEVVQTREPVTITRANRPLVVLVPAEDYGPGPSRAAVRETRLKPAAERVAEWKERHAGRLKGIDAAALIRAGRDRR